MRQSTYYDYYSLFLVVISISPPFAFNVSAVGCYYNRGEVGKPTAVWWMLLYLTACSSSSLKLPHRRITMTLSCTFSCRQHSLCLVSIFFLVNHIVWAVISGGNTVTESPPESPLWTPIALRDTVRGYWNKIPTGKSDFIFFWKEQVCILVCLCCLIETAWLKSFNSNYLICYLFEYPVCSFFSLWKMPGKANQTVPSLNSSFALYFTESNEHKMSWWNYTFDSGTWLFFTLKGPVSKIEHHLVVRRLIANKWISIFIHPWLTL